MTVGLIPLRLWSKPLTLLMNWRKTLNGQKNGNRSGKKEANEALKKFQLAVASKPRWIPVLERLPEKDGDYLAYVCLDDNEPFFGIFPFDSNVPGFGYWDEYYDPVTYGWAGSDFVVIKEVTHWMPLPTPPKEET